MNELEEDVSEDEVEELSEEEDAVSWGGVGARNELNEETGGVKSVMLLEREGEREGERCKQRTRLVSAKAAANGKGVRETSRVHTRGGEREGERETARATRDLQR